MDTERIQYLVAHHLQGTDSEEEREELYNLLRTGADEEALQQTLAEAWSRFETGVQIPLEQADRYFNEVMEAGRFLRPEPTVVKPLFHWKRWMVAASVILLLGLGAWLTFFQKQSLSPTKENLATNVPPPSANKARITLSDGRTVSLDSLQNGLLAKQGDVQLVKLGDGQIAYQGSTAEMTFNTLTNPRGSKVIDMALSDGSHVWLNAGSSVTYPVAFVGNERKVTITGEAYFEVAHDAAKTFYVSKGDVEVQVLGTHFNVNAYDDEEAIRVTLLEGSVRVAQNNNHVLIKPGQQAAVTTNHKLQTTNSVDIDEVMAWKNGRFYFEQADMPTIMRQLEKWYDVDVVFEDPIPYLFVAKIPREVPISEVLKLLELTNRVHFNVEGRKVTVMK